MHRYNLSLYLLCFQKSSEGSGTPGKKRRVDVGHHVPAEKLVGLDLLSHLIGEAAVAARRGERAGVALDMVGLLY